MKVKYLFHPCHSRPAWCGVWSWTSVVELADWSRMALKYSSLASSPPSPSLSMSDRLRLEPLQNLGFILHSRWGSVLVFLRPVRGNSTFLKKGSTRDTCRWKKRRKIQWPHKKNRKKMLTYLVLFAWPTLLGCCFSLLQSRLAFFGGRIQQIIGRRAVALVCFAN